MRKYLRHILIILSAFVLYGIYILIMPVLNQPLYVLLLVYTALLALFYFLNRRSIWAVRGNYFYLTGHYKRSMPILKKAVTSDTKSPAAYIHYALLLLTEDKNTADALIMLEKAEALSSSVVDKRNILTTRATCHWMDGNKDKAIEVFENMRTVPEYVNEGILTTLGYMYLEKKDFDKAMEITRLAMETGPGYGAAWDNMGQIYFRMGDMLVAKENFLAALSKKENLADSNFYLGIIAEADGDKSAAKEYFRRASICSVGMFNSVTSAQLEEKYNEYNA